MDIITKIMKSKLLMYLDFVMFYSIFYYLFRVYLESLYLDMFVLKTNEQDFTSNFAMKMIWVTN